jgi:recombination protein RecT
LTETDAIREQLAERKQAEAAPTIFDAVKLAEPRLSHSIPKGGMDWLYAKAALFRELEHNPSLVECNPHSLLGAFAATLQLGLPLGPLGLAYLVPFKREAACVIGYQGYIELAYRSGLVKAVRANLVYEGEPFREKGGTSPAIEHEIGHEDDAKIVAAYSVAELENGGKVWTVIREREWEKARAASVLGKQGKGFWVDHFPEAVLKTAVRRASKLWPKSPALMTAEAVDELPAPPLEIVDADDA